MKLIYRIILRVSLALSLILTVWAGLFYLAMIDEVNDETDDSLEDYAETIILRSLSGEELPSHDNGTNNQYYLTEVGSEYAAVHGGIRYIDSMIYIQNKKERESARILSTIFRNSEGRYFELIVAIPSIEKDDLRKAILYWIIFLYAALLITIIIITLLVVRKSMSPLYILLKWLDSYRIGQHTPPLHNPTQITEFRKLNEAILHQTARNEEIFEQQKEFIGNASHEIQTPLAICQNRLEMLMEDETLAEKQFGEVIKVYETLGQITRLNKSLLLLLKIDNGQFAEMTTICLNSLITKYLKDFEEVYAHRNITIRLEQNGNCCALLNESLTIVLLTNLLKNAFVHNVTDGRIIINITPDTIMLYNSGTEKPLDAEQIFKRFYQGNKQEGSSGLGLAIVEAICKFQRINIGYSFKNKLHCFRIIFRS